MFNKMNLTSSELELLNYLVTNPEASYCKKISKETKISAGATSQSLRKLNKLNLIKKEIKGREVYYSVNILEPLIKHFKIFSNLFLINPLINKLKDKSKKIILFGSFSKGEDTTESDIDIFILTDKKTEIKEIIHNNLIKFKKVSPIITDSNEFIILKNKDKALYNQINEGIVIWSEKDEY
ncbi:MAG: nucleotidyltransferase domain-containing protein [Candidatus Nanoarchaeia archaeon]|nr:nucleotidyltransferase domain-containing protein [Candidatus Nanoarchaeia archaeon]MDD5587577.1 nucleotidyltransferase domain-containing protein [Candidatus Nanoarchaeia archaeon]